ncbi:MAG: VWA domain-containing protein, partial [Lachnospiraceae bacterium]|nr:VWA domain-containing protein [Candidatus Equihabitans merdae]
MQKNLTELVFILDRSGSMGGLEKDTIGGFNAMIERQKKQEGQVNVTTVLFDDKYDMIHDRIPINDLRPMTEDDYYVRGCTALLDAMGETIHRMGNTQKYLVEEKRAEKVIFVITTDGMENASRHYDRAQIKRMIERQKEKYGWEFIFLGANMDAVAEAAR